MTIWLTPEEVGRLTDTAPRSYRAQRKRLAEMGMPFTASYCGKPLVAPEAARSGKTKRAANGPDWSNLPTRAA